jgi:hypothetical protein
MEGYLREKLGSEVVSLVEDLPKLLDWDSPEKMGL